MKKIIGLLGVVVIAATLFFTTDVVNNTSEDTTLASLITMNTANAEPDGEPDPNGWFWFGVEDIKNCPAYTRTVRTYFNSNGNVVGEGIWVDGIWKAGYTGTYSTYTSYSQPIPSHPSISRICPSGWKPFCETKVPCIGG